MSAVSGAACEPSFGFFFSFLACCIWTQHNAIHCCWPVTELFPCDHKWSALCTVGHSCPDVSAVLATFPGTCSPEAACKQGCCICFISPVLKWTDDETFQASTLLDHCVQHAQQPAAKLQPHLCPFMMINPRFPSWDLQYKGNVASTRWRSPQAFWNLLKQQLEN